MTSELEKAKDSLVLESVHLSNCDVSSKLEVNLASIEVSDLIAQDYRGIVAFQEPSKANVSLDDLEYKTYRIMYSVGVRLITPEEQESERCNEEGFAPLVEIKAVFNVNYVSKESLEKECIREFAKEHVGYHVWPYWREFVQSSCGRLGLHQPISIPPYRIGKTK